MNKIFLDNILQLFGNEESRLNFQKLCQNYYGERARMEAAEVSGEHLANSHRAIIHDEIMKIIQKLYLSSKDVMPSRIEVGKMIMEHFRFEEK